MAEEQTTFGFLRGVVSLLEPPLPLVSGRVSPLRGAEPDALLVQESNDVGWNAPRYPLPIRHEQVSAPPPKAQPAETVHRSLPAIWKTFPPIPWMASVHISIPDVPRPRPSLRPVKAGEKALLKEECP